MIRKISAKKVARGEVYRIKKSPVKRSNPARKKKEFARCYHSRARVAFVKSLDCAACGCSGHSENAHVLGNDGMGRKAGYQTVAPLCGAHPSRYVPGIVIGCHEYFDRCRSRFDASFRDFNPEKVAAEVEAAWLSFSGGSPKPEKSND